ncbi:MAG: hypothetical protein HPZ91_09215 [Lentisphaeria bacterium]|nr:hypothetical protein [Lentisphaeria bacterium]
MKWTKEKIENVIILAVCAAFLIFFNLKSGKGSADDSGFKVITSTTPAMIEEMAYAIKNNRCVAITAWSPHWMNARLPIKYLKDPEKVFGEAENVHTVVRKGFDEEYPEIAKFFRQFKWKTTDLDSLSLICYESDGDYVKGAREWLKRNPELPAAFLKGVRPQPGAKIKMVDIGFHNELATNAMLKILLEEHLKCEVSNVSTTIPIAFEALANGTQDVMVTVWLPNYHGREFARIRGRVLDLGVNLPGAMMGIAVPKYVPIDTIAELKKYRQEFEGKIIGNEPGQGILVLAEKALQAYGLTGEDK